MNDNHNVGLTVFKAVEETIFEAVRKNGTAYWEDLQAARVLIGDSYSDQGLQTDNATCLPFTFETLRLAYTHLYLTPHAHIVKEFLYRFWTSKRDFRIWHSQLQDGQLRVCCVGGGPGTDLLGLLLFFQKQEVDISNFRADVLERWSEWEETFRILIKNVCWENFERPTGDVIVDYWEFDFHKIWEMENQQCEHLTRLRQANLVTMVKFVSAVAAPDKDALLKKLISLLQLMKDGALLFFLDNAGGGYSRIVSQAAASAGLHLIGKFEHEDIGLPEHESAAISSSKLRLTKTKSEKTWKISTSLWQKNPKRSRPTWKLWQSHTSYITPITTSPNSHQYHPSLSQSAYRNISQSHTVSETQYNQVHVRTDILNYLLYQDRISQPYSTRQSRPSQQYSAPTNYSQTLTSQPYTISHNLNHNLPQPQILQPGLRQQHRYPIIAPSHQTSRSTSASSQSVIVSQPSSRERLSESDQGSTRGLQNCAESQNVEDGETGCCFGCLKM